VPNPISVLARAADRAGHGDGEERDLERHTELGERARRDQPGEQREVER
jgi:hypothetical protein